MTLPEALALPLPGCVTFSSYSTLFILVSTCVKEDLVLTLHDYYENSR